MRSERASGPGVRIRSVSVAHPRFRVTQDEAVRLLAERTGERKRLAGLARGSSIQQRALIMPPEELLELGGTGERSQRYWSEAADLAVEVATAACQGVSRQFHVVSTSTCTGYHLPGLAVELQSRLCLPATARRIPLTDPGCAGGVAALTLAADHLAQRPRSSGLAVSVELCSLSLQFTTSPGNLTAALIFGDGAGAAVLENGAGDGLRILQTCSYLVPNSRHQLGFELGDTGFAPVLDRDLATVLPVALRDAASGLAQREGVRLADIAAWLVHPGGARILREIGRELALPEGSMRWSWDSLAEFGNTSSAAIFDVIRRYMEEAPPAGELALIAAFGPGVAIELMLVQVC